MICVNTDTTVHNNIQVFTDVLNSFTTNKEIITSYINSDTTIIVQYLNELNVNTKKIGDDLNVSINILCPIEQHESEHVSFLVEEGEFILVDGKIFKVLK